MAKLIKQLPGEQLFYVAVWMVQEQFSNATNQMPFTVIPGNNVGSSKLDKTLTCHQQRSNIKICASECYDLHQNGSGCPGFYTDKTQSENCHVSSLTEINSNSYTPFTSDHLVYLILPYNTTEPDVAMDFDQFSSGTNLMNGTNTEGTTTNIMESDLVDAINGKEVYLHDEGKIRLTGSETECWTNLDHCSSGLTISIWMKPVMVANSYVVSTGTIKQRGISLLYKTDNKITTLVTLDDRRFEALSVSTLLVNASWYLVTGSYDVTDGASIFINGIMEKENQFENQQSETVNEVDWGAHIGVRDWTSYDVAYFNGFVDEFKYYYRLLNRAEIWREYVGYDIADIFMSPVSFLQADGNNYTAETDRNCRAMKLVIEGDESTREDYTMTIIKDEDVQCRQKGYILYAQHESLSEDNEDNNSCDCQYSVKLRRCMVDQSCGELCYSRYKYVESITDNVEWRYCEIEFY